MSKRKRSISRMVYLYAALAIIAVVVVVVGWMASDKFGQYIEERTQLIEQVNTMISNIDFNPIEQIEEIERSSLYVKSAPRFSSKSFSVARYWRSLSFFLESPCLF